MSGFEDPWEGWDQQDPPSTDPPQNPPPADPPMARDPLRVGQIQPALIDQQGQAAQAKPDGPVLLPPEFWAARPKLEFIRRYANSRGASPEAVFCGGLAILASRLPNACRVDTGMLKPLSLNMMVAAVGPPGFGKTSGADMARHLLQGRIELDELALSTGEGIAEAYMVEQKLDPDQSDWSAGGQGGVTKAGRGRSLTVRKQGHWNAMFVLDEGEAMFREFERDGAKLGPILRSAWMGNFIGAQNADRSRTRKVHDFCLGLMVGFQPTTALPLLRDVLTGTPQRFLWCDVTNPNIPDQQPQPLQGVLQWQRPELGQTITSGLYDQATGQWRVTMSVHPQISRGLWDLHVAKNRGEVQVDVHDAQKPTMMVKLAGLLAVLDGRVRLELEDWELARIVWDYSASVRDGLLKLAEQQAQAEAAKRLEMRRQNAIADTEGKQEADERRQQMLFRLGIGRVSGKICRMARQGATRKDLRQAFKSTEVYQREILDDLIDHAVEQGMAVELAGRWYCGHTPRCYSS